MREIDRMLLEDLMDRWMNLLEQETLDLRDVEKEKDGEL
tara:strand:- start:561 stop:677 length:117 start_codon:yes stop_codon:yes gene_type:complete